MVVPSWRTPRYTIYDAKRSSTQVNHIGIQVRDQHGKRSLHDNNHRTTMLGL
jgi:hypothetical protein